MKTTLLAAALVVTAAAAPLALAGPGGHGHDPQHGGDRVAQEPAAGPQHAAPGRRGRGPALVARGTIGSLDVAGGSFELTLAGGNRPLRRIAGAADTLTVTLDVETAVDPFTTRIRKAGRGRAAVADLSAGDRVVVTWRAPRGTTAAGLAEVEAQRVVARAPRPAAEDDGAAPDEA